MSCGADAERFLQAIEREADTIENEHPAVLVLGFGRYGQTVARVLSATGVRATVIDHNANTIDSARRFGFKVYFGDATQADLLHAAGIAHARTVVVAGGFHTAALAANLKKAGNAFTV